MEFGQQYAEDVITNAKSLAEERSAALLDSATKLGSRALACEAAFVAMWLSAISFADAFEIGLSGSVIDRGSDAV